MHQQPLVGDHLVAHSEHLIFVRMELVEMKSAAGGGTVVMTPVNVVNFMVPFPVLGMLTRKILSSVAEVLTGNSRKPLGSAAVK